MIREESEALRLLACRIHETEYRSWRSIYPNPNSLDQCFICGEVMHYSKSEEHGIFHLREHNLLAFI